MQNFNLWVKIRVTSETQFFLKVLRIYIESRILINEKTQVLLENFVT